MPDDGVAALRRHGCGDRGARHQGTPNLQVGATADREHMVQRDFLANVRSDLLDFEFFASGNPILLTAGLDDCVHFSPFDWISRCDAKNTGSALHNRALYPENTR